MNYDLRARAAVAELELAVLAFNPHQRRGPDGRWIKMPTSELKRPRVGKQPRVVPAAKATDGLPQINVPDPGAEYRTKRDEYNDTILRYAKNMQDTFEGRRDPALAQRIAHIEQLGVGTDEADDAVDQLRNRLDYQYQGRMVLDPPPAEVDSRPLPVLPPGNRTTGGPRPAITAPYDRRREALDSSVRSGISGQEMLGGGAMGDTRRVRLADGTEAIYKRAQRGRGGWSTVHQTDAEELGSLVAAAVGVRAPAIQRVDDTNLYMEVMPGVPAVERRWHEPPEDIRSSDTGKRMGLLDVLINNPDRHAGNWMIDDQDQIYAIDHGLAFLQPGFEVSAAKSSEFATSHFITRRGEYRKQNDLSRLDIEQLRSRLQEVEPRFQELGRSDWFDSMSRRLDKLASHAVGSQAV